MCPMSPGLLDRLPGLAWTTDASLALEDVFGAGLSCLEIVKVDYIGRPVWDLFPPVQSKGATKDPYRQALGGQPAAFELEIRGRALVARVEPRTDDHGSIVG